MDLLGSYERGSTVLDAKRTPCTPYCGKADLAWAMPFAESQYAGWYELWLIADVSWSSYCCLTSHIRIWGSWPNQLPHCRISRTQLTKGDNCNRPSLLVTWSAWIECTTLCPKQMSTAHLFQLNPLRANYCHTWHMENHPCLWRRICRVRRIQVCMARKGLRWLGTVVTSHIASNRQAYTPVMSMLQKDVQSTHCTSCACNQPAHTNTIMLWILHVVVPPYKMRQVSN